MRGGRGVEAGATTSSRSPDYGSGGAVVRRRCRGAAAIVWRDRDTTRGSPGTAAAPLTIEVAKGYAANAGAEPPTHALLSTRCAGRWMALKASGGKAGDPLAGDHG